MQTPGKSIRIDYLRRAIDELTRDRTSTHAFFHRGLPVNVEAWLRALCEHDVATHVPTRWTRKRSRTRASTRSRRSSGHEDRDEDRIGGSTFADTASAVVETRLASSRLSELDVQQLDGLFARGGRVVVVVDVGTQTTTWTGLAVEPNGDVVRTYDSTDEGGTSDKLPFDPRDVLLSRLEGDAFESSSPPTPAPQSSWTFVAVGFVFDDDGPNAVRVESYRGLSTHVASGLRIARATRLRAFVDEIAARRLDAISSTPSTGPSTGPLVRTRSDIAALLALSVKRKHDSWVEEALRTEDRDDDERREERRDETTTTTARSDVPDVVPTECRNAWVLADGTIVETRDKTLSRVVSSKRRWNAGKSCVECSAGRHPDPFVSGRESCSSATCARAFRYCSTTTHWVFRDGRRRRIELDMNAPLFTDESLATLRSAVNARETTRGSSSSSLAA